jgi:hypothetical protein
MLFRYSNNGIMDNYFISYDRKRNKSYIIPEINIISNNTSRDSIIEDSDNPLLMEVSRLTEKFNPFVFRFSHPIALDVFVFGPDGLYYKVIEGLYMLEDGTMKLKVKKKYGK